ncbi:MAG: YlxR family protein [Candidatus Melainabacteria bacterium]|nr:YlxR family protein [Candidatus Melainabacteria bacterium]
MKNQNHKNLIRQCITCRKQSTQSDLIRLTKIHDLGSGLEQIILNPNKYQLGRSIYLCKNSDCVNKAIKEKKLQKMLKVPASKLSTIINQLLNFPQPQNLRNEVAV